MFVEEIIRQGSEVKNSNDAQALMLRISDLVLEMPEVNPCQGPLNCEGYLENPNEPHITFEFSRLISQDYLTEISPELRSGEFVITVRTYHMKDGLGFQSRNFDVFQDMDDLIEGDGDRDLRELMCEAKDIAIKHHTKLIQSVGVGQELAVATAEKSWS